MTLNKRKHPRLKEFDYSTNGCYFATICVKDRKNLLGNIEVGRDALIPPCIELTNIGNIVDKYIKNINCTYDDVWVDTYVIMPNHIHLLIVMQDNYGGMRASRPTLHTIIRSLKTMVTREIGYSIWQNSYYDHIIRNKNSYLEITKYIEENPLKWRNDELFNE